MTIIHPYHGCYTTSVLHSQPLRPWDLRSREPQSDAAPTCAEMVPMDGELIHFIDG